ncbi:MAG: hypothetical protein ABH862_02720 [Candidatus Omnitrophota bacterium]
MKKVLILLVILTIMGNVCTFASTNKPLQKIGKGLDNVVYGDMEVSDCMNETKTKGSPAFTDCTSATNDDVGRGIARFVGGVWQLATFWYPED